MHGEGDEGNRPTGPTAEDRFAGWSIMAPVVILFEWWSFLVFGYQLDSWPRAGLFGRGIVWAALFLVIPIAVVYALSPLMSPPSWSDSAIVWFAIVFVGLGLWFVPSRGEGYWRGETRRIHNLAEMNNTAFEDEDGQPTQAQVDERDELETELRIAQHRLKDATAYKRANPFWWLSLFFWGNAVLFVCLGKRARRRWNLLVTRMDDVEEGA